MENLRWNFKDGESCELPLVEVFSPFIDIKVFKEEQAKFVHSVPLVQL